MLQEGQTQANKAVKPLQVEVSATGPAAIVQWDRLGLYYATDQILHGRQVGQLRCTLSNTVMVLIFPYKDTFLP